MQERKNVAMVIAPTFLKAEEKKSAMAEDCFVHIHRILQEACRTSLALSKFLFVESWTGQGLACTILA